MLDGSSPLWEHSLQNIAPILLSLVFLPLNTYIVFWVSAYNRVFQSKVQQRRNVNRNKSFFKPKTILVTGVGMTKGLALARLFYEAGHDVIGADFEPSGTFVSGRVSKALKKFLPLQKPNAKSGSAPYIQSLLKIVTTENVDLWVSCSGVASAVEDGEAKEIIEARTSCKAIQFDVNTTQMLHEKHTFIAHTEEIGLTTPETHTITSRAEVDAALRNAPAGRKYIMKTIGMVDAFRADMTLLPKSTPQETAKHLSKLAISVDSPWILQQFIQGQEYCTHALIVKGQVKAFVACPSAELLMHYESLPPPSKLSLAMLKFTKIYAEAGGDSFTGHLSFDFLVYQDELDNLYRDIDATVTLYPIECNPRAHTAVALFNGTTQMADAYLSLLDDAPQQYSTSLVKGNITDKIVFPQDLQTRYYWIGHDLVNLIFLPLLSLLTLQHDSSITSVIQGINQFLGRLLSWKDGTFELWDPLPWWWLYHVYWPGQFWNALMTGRKWSRINVSTCKVFDVE